MTIDYNPTISGGFVHHVMKDEKVLDEITKAGLTKETAHNLIKAVLICGTRDLRIDFNRVVERRVDRELDKVLEDEEG